MIYYYEHAGATGEFVEVFLNARSWLKNHE